MCVHMGLNVCNVWLKYFFISGGMNCCIKSQGGWFIWFCFTRGAMTSGADSWSPWEVSLT